MPGQALRVLVYRNFPLETRNENITRALILVHGGTRNADQQLCVPITYIAANATNYA